MNVSGNMHPYFADVSFIEIDKRNNYSRKAPAEEESNLET